MESLIQANIAAGTGPAVVFTGGCVRELEPLLDHSRLGALVRQLTPCTTRPGPRELLVGSWVLVSREDLDANGRSVPEPALGPDPVGFLVYDANGNVAVQLMRRSRDAARATPPRPAPSLKGNSGSADGYDAYFGTYEVDTDARTVTHHLVGVLLPQDIGKSLVPPFRGVGNRAAPLVRDRSSLGAAGSANARLATRAPGLGHRLMTALRRCSSPHTVWWMTRTDGRPHSR